MSLFDRIDMDVDKARKCKVKIQGRDAELVALHKDGDRIFAVLAGGRKVEIDNETLKEFDKKLEEHLIKHIYNK